MKFQKPRSLVIAGCSPGELVLQLRLEAPVPSPYLDSTNCWSGSQNSGEHLSIKGLLKGTDEHADGEMHRGRSGRVPSAGASVPLELGCVSLLVRVRVNQHGSSPNPGPWDCVEAPSCGHDLHNCISSPSPLPGETRG